MKLKEEADPADEHSFFHGLHRAVRLESLLDLLADDSDFFHPAAVWIDKLGLRTSGNHCLARFSLQYQVKVSAALQFAAYDVCLQFIDGPLYPLRPPVLVLGICGTRLRHDRRTRLSDQLFERSLNRSLLDV